MIFDFFKKKGKAKTGPSAGTLPLWADQVKQDIIGDREEYILSNVTEILQGEFPDDDIKSVIIFNITHFTHYTVLECVPKPSNAGSPSWLLVMKFGGKPEVMATYHVVPEGDPDWEEGKYQMLSSGNMPSDMPNELNKNF